MIKLGFVSAILADQTFEEVISFAALTGYSCVEIMCWPVGKAERRYAGVTHIDVTDLSKKKMDEIQDSYSSYADDMEIESAQKTLRKIKKGDK